MGFLYLVSIVTIFAGPARAEERPSEFCRIALPAIQAPFACTGERKSAAAVEALIGSYGAVCPGLQTRFETLDQERQTLVHRCVLFNALPSGEPAGCAEDRARVTGALRTLDGDTFRLLDQTNDFNHRMGADAPREAACRTFHEQHRDLVRMLRERLLNLRAATARALRDTESPARPAKDHERVKALPRTGQ